MKALKFSVVTDIDKLHQKSQEVDMTDKNLVYRLLKCLKEAYTKLDGKLQGLSAIQVGEPYCAILLRYVKGQEPIVVYNPKILLSLGSKKSNEGCLSESGHRYLVKRPRLIKVQYYTESGDMVKEWLTYKKARIFMHEFDHTQGVLLQDKGRIDDKEKLLFGKYRITPDYKFEKVK